jgi:hypothetical protein
MTKDLAVVIVAMVFGAASLSGRLNGEDLYKNLRPAVCLIQGADENGQEVTEGTGFFVKNDLVVTNRHFVETGRTIAVKTYDNHILVPVKIWIQQVKEDLAILEMDTCGPAQLELAGDEDPLALEGSRVTVFSNRIGLEETVSDGIISGFRNDPDVIEIMAPVSPGSTGSPVFNESGKVIGIVTSGATDGHGLNFAAASADIRSEVDMVNMSKQAASLCSANRNLPEPPFTFPFGGSPEDVVKTGARQINRFLRERPLTTDECGLRKDPSRSAQVFGIIDACQRPSSGETRERLAELRFSTPWSVLPGDAIGSYRTPGCVLLIFVTSFRKTDRSGRGSIRSIASSSW